MSKERARARAARLTARAAERNRRERQRARRRQLERLKPSLPRRVLRSRRRYGALPLQVKVGLACGWLLVQFLIWQAPVVAAARVGVSLVTVVALPVVVVLVVNPARRSR